MYSIFNYATGQLLETVPELGWVKQQDKVDLPIACDSYDEADGVVLSDGNTMLGIEGRGMQNYTPTVIVKETNGDKYILMRLQVLEDTVNIMNQGVVMANEAVAQVYDAQTNGTVPKTELNEAYKEGVNSYAG